MTELSWVCQQTWEGLPTEGSAIPQLGLCTAEVEKRGQAGACIRPALFSREMSRDQLRHTSICVISPAAFCFCAPDFPTMMAWTLNPGLKQTVFPWSCFYSRVLSPPRKGNCDRKVWSGQVCVRKDPGLRQISPETYVRPQGWDM